MIIRRLGQDEADDVKKRFDKICDSAKPLGSFSLDEVYEAIERVAKPVEDDDGGPGYEDGDEPGFVPGAFAKRCEGDNTITDARRGRLRRCAAIIWRPFRTAFAFERDLKDIRAAFDSGERVVVLGDADDYPYSPEMLKAIEQTKRRRRRERFERIIASRWTLAFFVLVTLSGVAQLVIAVRAFILAYG